MPIKPVIILVGPQLGENIGSVARVMSNFGLSELRIVTPRDGWPNPKALEMAAHGKFIIENAQIYDTLSESIKDLNYVLASAANYRSMEKTILEPEAGARNCHNKIIAGNKVGIMFGRERSGLTNEEIIIADTIVTIPTSPINPSLNLAQAVCVLAYEFHKLNTSKNTQEYMQANKHDIELLFADLEQKLDECNFFKVPEKKEKMFQNIRNIYIKAQLTEQEVRTLRGIIKAFANNA